MTGRHYYSVPALAISALFGGPLSAVAFAAIEARALDRLRKDVAWLAAGVAAFLGAALLADRSGLLGHALEDLGTQHLPAPDTRPMRRTLIYRDRALFTDLDQSLLGDEAGVGAFAEVMRRNRRCTNFGIATGRRLDSALAVLKRHRLPIPDVLITSLGTQIHYSAGLVPDGYWTEHVDHLWKPAAVRRALSDIPGLVRQPKDEQSRFKLSYLYDPQIAPSVDEIVTLLRTKDLSAHVFLSFGQFLDIVPVHAGKGQALRYVAHRFGIPLEHILVAGGSGADADMMRGNTLAVVVANRHHEELSQLAELERVYFAERPHAFGILEAIDHYDFFRSCTVPGTQ